MYVYTGLKKQNMKIEMNLTELETALSSGIFYSSSIRGEIQFSSRNEAGIGHMKINNAGYMVEEPYELLDSKNGPQIRIAGVLFTFISIKPKDIPGEIESFIYKDAEGKTFDFFDRDISAKK